MTAHCLTIQFDGAASWPRPRLRRGRIVYPDWYDTLRGAWAGLVAGAVAAQGWAVTTEPVRMTVVVYASGRLDLDRAVTLVCDVLQKGGAYTDDCRVDRIEARRVRLRPGEGPAHTLVQVCHLADDCS